MGMLAVGTAVGLPPTTNDIFQQGTITILDSLPPKVVAQNIVVYLNGSGNATITAADVDGGSSDNCGVSLSIDNSSFGCANVGANTVVLTGTDPSGNTASASGTVTVRDSTKPAVIAQDITIFLDVSGQSGYFSSTREGEDDDLYYWYQDTLPGKEEEE